uniref:Uncharacterized protein n=1 Tax=Anguilla anguilla TaxID=7936 RepID=A0A0E9Q7G8_ANGAN
MQARQLCKATQTELTKGDRGFVLAVWVWVGSGVKRGETREGLKRG